MKSAIRLILVLLVCASLNPAPSHAQEQKATLEDFAWLAGCWEDNRGNRFREEVWLKPKGDTMLGLGRTVIDGKTTEFEFIRLHEERGEIFYTAKPSRQPEASFKLVSSKAGEAIFENPQHDFPQRIIYRRQPDGSLVARIEGELKGNKRGIDFPFKRAKCE